MEELITPWFVKYVDMSPDAVFELSMAAYYLQMQGLMELTACKIACAIRGKSMRNVRNYYKDLEAQQVEQAGTGNEESSCNQKWAEESFSNQTFPQQTMTMNEVHVEEEVDSFQEGL